MPKLKPGGIIPTAAEDAAINRGMAARPDTAEATSQDQARARPVGRPPLERKKVQLTVRYDQDVVAAFRAGGPGWQTRMNDALREWLRQHS